VLMVHKLSSVITLKYFVLESFSNHQSFRMRNGTIRSEWFVVILIKNDSEQIAASQFHNSGISVQ
jgi:phage protein U